MCDLADLFELLFSPSKMKVSLPRGSFGELSNSFCTTPEIASGIKQESRSVARKPSRRGKLRGSILILHSHHPQVPHPQTPGPLTPWGRVANVLLWSQACPGPSDHQTWQPVHPLAMLATLGLIGRPHSPCRKSSCADHTQPRH